MAMRREVLRRLRVEPGTRFRMADHAPDWLPDHLRGLGKRARRVAAAQMLADNVAELAEVQDLLYADNRYSLLIVLQAMDAAGKDGTIKHVMSGVNPQGCTVHSFKKPCEEEIDHDFLWRFASRAPARGMIGIFNRSYYENVLVEKVHPELLEASQLPDGKRNTAFWRARYEDINAFEKHLTNNGTIVLKFFLNVSPEEQRARFLDRLDDPSKHWKFSAADMTERGLWEQYQQAFTEAIRATSTAWAPWYVIPADRKWAMRAMVSDIIVTTLQGLHMHYPDITDEAREQMAAAREQLQAELAAELARNG